MRKLLGIYAFRSPPLDADWSSHHPRDLGGNDANETTSPSYRESRKIPNTSNLLSKTKGSPFLTRDNIHKIKSIFSQNIKRSTGKQNSRIYISAGNQVFKEAKPLIPIADDEVSN